MNGWIGIDLDGTLAEYNGWINEHHIGKPVPKMVDKVKELLATGQDVRIFTARVYPYPEQEGRLSAGETATIIQDWTEEHLGKRLPVTCSKDYGMVTIYDDRCKQVSPNEGNVLEEEHLNTIAENTALALENQQLKAEIKRLTESRLELAKQ